MPYARKRRRPSYARPTRSVKRRRTSTYARRAYNRLCKPEAKFIEPSDSISVSTTGDINHLTAIAGGTSRNERTGRKIMGKSLVQRWKFTINASATSTNIRLIQFRWFDDSAPTVTDILEAAHTLEVYKTETSEKYRVIMDKLITLSTNRPKTAFKTYMRIMHPITYTGSASTDYQRGQIFTLAVSDEATNTPTMVVRGRLRYTDV